MMGHPSDWWAGEGGTAYLQRNRVDWRARIPFWTKVLDVTGARSVYEFGCNAGYNLSAIRRVYPDVMCYGLDANRQACDQARACGFDVFHDMGGNGEPKRGACDLVLTVGVLIHIPPDELSMFMQRVIDASADYILAVEYESEAEEAIEYRGEQGLLWKMPFGKLYEEMGLTLVEKWDAGSAFDRCTAWLMRK